MSKKNKGKEKEEDKNGGISIFIMMILLLVAIFIWNESNSNQVYEPSLQDVRDTVQIEVIETTIITTSTPFVVEVVPEIAPTLQPTISPKQQFENALFSKDWVIVPLAYSHDTLQSCIEVAKSSPLLVSPKCLNYISFETDRCTNQALENYGLCEELP